MNQNSQLATINLRVESSEDADPEEIQQLSFQLYDELNEIDIESAEFVSAEELPEGAKGIPIAPEIAVSVFMPIAIEVFKTCYFWLKRREDRNIKVRSILGEQEFELIITSKGYQEEEVDKFIELMARST